MSPKEIETLGEKEHLKFKKPSWFTSPDWILFLFGVVLFLTTFRYPDSFIFYMSGLFMGLGVDLQKIKAIFS